MRATYSVRPTPDHLVKIGTAPYHITYIVGNDVDWDYTRRAKHFYETKEKAYAAGERYLKKMKQNGFEI